MPGRNNPVSLNILLVEDSPDDAELMIDALREGSFAVHVDWVEDGEQALAFLHRRDNYQQSATPDLILLDLRLPRKNGREVLDEIKQHPVLRCIPVVIMTANDAAITELYDHQPNCCVVKPADQDEFRLAVKKIERFWLTIAARVRLHHNDPNKGGDTL